MEEMRNSRNNVASACTEGGRGIRFLRHKITAFRADVLRVSWRIRSLSDAFALQRHIHFSLDFPGNRACPMACTSRQGEVKRWCKNANLILKGSIPTCRAQGNYAQHQVSGFWMRLCRVRRKLQGRPLIRVGGLLESRSAVRR